jgi:oxygen-independent coproporphyrinogen-3 oxidase
VPEQDLPFEFFMNRFRLLEPCPKSDYSDFTGISLDKNTKKNLQTALTKGLLVESSDNWQVTPLGRRYLNTLLEMMV